MKKFLLFMTAVLLTAVYGYSQAPGIFNYQGVARNSVGNVLVNKSITLRITIHDGAAAGPVVYQETRGATTNPFGLFNVQVGSPGAITTVGTIAGVPWGVGTKHIQVEIDPNGGSTFINIGTAQVASVPYALYSNIAGDLILPYNKTQADAGTLFKITNSGTGSGSTALEGLTNSTANNVSAIIGTVTPTGAGSSSTGVRGINNGTAGQGIGVWGSQNGSGWGVYGQTPGGRGVYGSTTTGTGVYGDASSGVGVYGISNTGRAGFFENTNAANAAATLFATSNGTGWTADFVSTNATTRALRTAGGLRFTGINEGLNRILASDATGNALWQNPAAIGIVSGSGTLNWVPKWTPDGTTLGNSIIEDRGINIVGVNVPVGYTYTNVQQGMEIHNAAALLQARIVLRDVSDGGDIQAFVDARTSPTATLTALQLGTSTNHPITFFSNGTHMGRWSTAGNLGIGTAAGTDPTAKLQVTHAATTQNAANIAHTGATNTASGMIVSKTNATHAGFADATLFVSRGTGAAAFVAGSTGIKGGSSDAAGIGVQGSANGFGVVGYTQSANGAGLFGWGNSATSYALATQGRVQITGQGAALNNILTSDAVGNATWQPLGALGGVTGSGTLNFIPKWTPNGTTLGNSMMFDNGTSVNVGTSTPDNSTMLLSAAVNPSLRIKNATSAAVIGGVYLGPFANQDIYLGTNENSALRLYLDGSERARLSNVGNFGVGNFAPLAKIDVTGFTAANNLYSTLSGFSGVTGLGVQDATAEALNEKWGIHGHANGSASINHSVFAESGTTGIINVGLFGRVSTAPVGGASYGLLSYDAVNTANATWAGGFYGKVQILDGTQGVGRVFTSDAIGTGSWQTAAAAGLVSGAGTNNQIAKWTPDGATLGNSLMFDNGNTVSVGSPVAWNNSLSLFPTPGATEPSLFLGSGQYGGIYVEQATGQMHFTANNANVVTGNKVMTLDDDLLALGIGTTAPVAKMHIDNTFAGNGALFVNQDLEVGIPAAKVLSGGPIGLDVSLGFGDNSFFAQRGDFLAGTIYSITGAAAVQAVSPAGNGIEAASHSGVGVYTASTTGTALRAFSLSGLAIRSEGGVRLVGLGEANGYVLTSDGAGNATWQENTSQSVGISLHYFTGNLNIPSNVFVPVTQWSIIENEDGGANYNNITGQYTITKTGVYQLNASILWNPFNAAGRAGLYSLINGVFYNGSESFSPVGDFFSTTMNGAVRLTAGDVVSFSVYQTSLNAQSIGSAYNAQSASIQFLHK